VPLNEGEQFPVSTEASTEVGGTAGVQTASGSRPRIARIKTAIAARGPAVGVLLIVGLAILGNLLWIVQDHQSPAWDQAHYLDIAWLVRQAFSTGGLSAGVSAIYHTDPSYAPLYMLLIQPFETIKNGVDAALVANTLMLAGTIIATAVIAYKLFGRPAAVAAALFEATCPIVYGLSRTTLVDILLVFLAALAVMAAVLSNGFQRRGWSLLCGAFVGLACLTKMTAPGILLLPLALSLWLPQRVEFRRQLVNAVLAAIVAVVVSLCWYGIDLSAALSYLQAATNGELAVGGTTNPLTLQAFSAFASLTFYSAAGTLLILVLIVAAVLAAPRAIHRHLTRSALVRVAIPLSWLAVPFAVVAASHNQDVRYVAPGMTGLAILAGGLITAVRPRLLSQLVMAVAAVALVCQYTSYVIPQTDASISSGTGGFSVVIGPQPLDLTIPFGDAGLVYTSPPGIPNYAAPIVNALHEYQERTAPTSPLDVCFLETQAVINGNTIGYVAESSGVSLTFTDLSYIPQVSAQALASDLSACPVALYIPGDSGQGRVALLNSASGAARITASDIAGFNGPRPVLPVGDGLTVEILEHG
jgi:hypothetical protein